MIAQKTMKNKHVSLNTGEFFRDWGELDAPESLSEEEKRFRLRKPRQDPNSEVNDVADPDRGVRNLSGWGVFIP